MNFLKKTQLTPTNPSQTIPIAEILVMVVAIVTLLQFYDHTKSQQEQMMLSLQENLPQLNQCNDPALRFPD